MQVQQICPARILVPPRTRFPDFCLRAESAYWRIQYSHRSAFVNLILPFLTTLFVGVLSLLSGITSNCSGGQFVPILRASGQNPTGSTEDCLARA